MIIRAALSVGIFLLISGCKINTGERIQEQDHKTVHIDTANVVMDKYNFDDTLAYFVNDTFSIELRNAFSAGKLWKIENLPSNLNLLSQNDIQKIIENQYVDCQQFWFSGFTADTLALKFYLVRPYGPDKTASDSIKYQIIIKNK